MNNLKLIGVAIRNRRKEMSLSQEELGYMVNLAKNTISNIELGCKDFKISTLLKLMVALKIDFSYFSDTQLNSNKI